tara:strand:+ start:6490 stop:8040 length:1551 start_codon:yes stop_codon:yes gene_type:complete
MYKSKTSNPDKSKGFDNLGTNNETTNSQENNLQVIQNKANNSSIVKSLESVQLKSNNSSIPNNLKSGVENVTGVSMDDVKVHYNSSEPAKVNAHAYAQGNEVHLGAGQEKHLPHELGHVAQQKKMNVKPDSKINGQLINTDQKLEMDADSIGQKAINYNSNNNIQLKSIDSESNTLQLKDPPTTGSKPLESIPEGNEDEDEDELVTPGGLEINADGLDDEQKKTAMQNTDEVVDSLSFVGSIAGRKIGTAFDNKKVEELADPKPTYLENLKQVHQNSANPPGGQTFFSVMGSVFGIGSALKDMTFNFLDSMDKWTQWTAYKRATEKENPPEEAVYGLSKVWKGFWTKVGGFFEAILRLATSILLLTPAAAIGATIKIAHKIKDGVSWMMSLGKRIFQFFKGQKKETNSKSLLEKALNHDSAALELILGLELPSVKRGKLPGLNKWVFDRKQGIGSIMGAEKANRIVDEKDDEGNLKKDPENAEDLYDRLSAIIENSPASRKLIEDEIKVTMTGVGV